jgi:hypothetical protein
MNLELVGHNAVVVAHQFNPSVISQVWLVRNGIIVEEDIGSGCVFTDVVVQMHSEKFNLLVTPQQCQFAPPVDDDRPEELVVEKVGTLVQNLPHTPYNAMGLNFIWHATPPDVCVASRNIFFNASSPLFGEFDTEDARFGAYMSKDALGCRLRLNIKPVVVTPPGGEPLDTLQFSFNFHRDVGNEDDPVASIMETLEKWNEASEMSEHIVHKVNGVES